MKRLIHNGKIYTMTAPEQTVEAVLIEEGRISAIGRYDELVDLADEQLDLQGATMYPGFVDSHLHMIGTGLKLTRLDLSDVQSAEDMLYLIAEQAKKTADDEWLWVESFNENNFPDQRIPTMAELDAITTMPLIVSRVCRHVFLGNRLAFDLAGITEATANPQGGLIGRHSSGELNGLLYEQAADLLKAAIPQEGAAFRQQLENVLHHTIEHMHARGLTGGHSEEMAYFGHYNYSYNAYKKVLLGRKDFRANLLIHNEVFAAMMEDELLFDDDFMSLGAMKIFADGSFGGSTAALLEPYADDFTNKGLLIQDDIAMEELFQLAQAYSRPIAVHTIGDAAATQVIKLMENYPPPSGTRHRIIHACLLNEDLLHRMTKIDLAVDIQPTFVTSDFPWVGNKIGEQRLPYAFPWKSLLDAGIKCGGGSDSPIEPVDPLAGIYAAITRKKPEENHGGYVPQQKLTRYEALRLYTVGSAEMIHHEHDRGMIQPGYIADFTIFKEDLFTIAIEKMLQAQVKMTIVDGKIVFENN
ncbi:amidohydrolase [Kurthia sibirica]|uniref:Amidohydrolase n=1 Tax=Kurthia sibirica TaxID=202750 RepID=A0A2U3AIX7_9BACL|nr:amidohydrolase [Kurthia sibirica]PWI24512.1 amidohydrolase [Kurthia sibirica]GEK33580.1 amidohydrolase [Kurthia sibirica]